MSDVGRIGDSRRKLEDERLHQQVAAELEAEFEEHVQRGLERYDNEPAYRYRVHAIANMLHRDPLMETLHPDVRSSACTRMALRMVVANGLIGERQLADAIHRRGGPI